MTKMMLMAVLGLTACGESFAQTDAGCAPRDLISVVPDADADGFGDAFAAGRVACIAPPPGFAIDRSDCGDGDARANPTATAFSTTPILGGGNGRPTWDFNCNGVVELQYPVAQNCNTIGQGGGCLGSPGSSEYWLGSVPACGAQGSWVSVCVAAGGGCFAQTISRMQGCR